MSVQMSKDSFPILRPFKYESIFMPDIEKYMTFYRVFYNVLSPIFWSHLDIKGHSLAMLTKFRPILTTPGWHWWRNSFIVKRKIDISGTTYLPRLVNIFKERPLNKHFLFYCRRSPTQRIYPTFWACLLPTHHLRRTGPKIGFGASKTKLNPPWWLYRRLTWCRWLWH